MICLLTFSNLFYPPNNPKRSNQMEVLDDFDNSDENMVIIHGTDDMEDKTNAEHCASINDPYSVHNIDFILLIIKIQLSYYQNWTN